jgi:hypothetical protein
MIKGSVGCTITIRWGVGRRRCEKILRGSRWKTPDEVRPLVAFVSHAIMTLDVISKGLDHEIASHSVS